MAQQTIDRFYPSYAEAVQVVADLTSSGVPPRNISLIDNETDARLPRYVTTSSTQNPLTTGATLGAAIGGGIGVLDGVGAISIPYTGPLVATGWILPCIVFALVGAVIGAAIGAIAKLGVRNKPGMAIATRLQRGQTLVMVIADDADAAMVKSVMERTHTVPTAALATSEPLYDVPVPTVAHTVGDEVDPPIARVERRSQVH